MEKGVPFLNLSDPGRQYSGAARGGLPESNFPLGDSPGEKDANVGNRNQCTQAVKTYKPILYGLFVNGGRKVRRCRLKSETPVPQNGSVLSLGQVPHDALNTFG